MTQCNDRPGYLPRFQPQNPAKSGDRNGWVNCTAYSAAMAADLDSCGSVKLTGEDVRRLSDEPIPDRSSPGLNLRQVDASLDRYGIDLEIRYGLPWADFARKIDKGEGAILQISTGPFLTTKYRSTAGAINHAIFVPPGWGAMDPAADGRQSYWKYDGSPYPKDLLRRAAGRLEFSPGNPLGIGKVYAAFTRDRRSTWTWQRGAGKFVIWQADEQARTCRARRTQRTGGTQVLKCTPPRLYKAPDGSTRSLVRLLEGAYQGDYVHSRWSKEIP